MFCVRSLGHPRQEANVVVAVGSNDEVGDYTQNPYAIELKEAIVDLKPGTRATLMLVSNRHATPPHNVQRAKQAFEALS